MLQKDKLYLFIIYIIYLVKNLSKIVVKYLYNKYIMKKVKKGYLYRI